MRTLSPPQNLLPLLANPESARRDSLKSCPWRGATGLLSRVWKTKARTEDQLLPKPMITFTLIGFVRFLARVYPSSFAATACEKQPRPLLLHAANEVTAVIPSHPRAVSPRPEALRRKEATIAKKRSESAQLISAIKTNTGGALLDYTHFFPPPANPRLCR